MAFFDRADERDQLIKCNICNVFCNERSITTHRVKCADKNPAKFRDGSLEKCSYDSSHIVEKGTLSLHYEFCRKRQAALRDEYQKAEFLNKNKRLLVPLGKPSGYQSEEVPFDPEEDWGASANCEPFISSMAKLSLREKLSNQSP